MTASNRPKLVAVFQDPAALKEIVTAAGAHLDVLPARESKRLPSVLDANPTVLGVIAEHTSKSSGAIELLQLIRSARPNLRRLLLSEYADLTLVVEALHSGLVDAIVYRPVDWFELRNALRVSAPPAVASAPAAAPARV